MSDSPHDSTDQRDERLAALLQPAPLDEVTRARLVRAAMDASETHTGAADDETPRSRSRARWFAVAAAVVLVIAVGITAVITRDDSGSGPTAARASRPPTLPLESTTDLTISPEAFGSTELRIIDTQVGLGDLGDVGTNAKLRRAVAAAAADAPASSASPASPSSASKSSGQDEQAATTLPPTTTTVCADFPRGEIVGVGTGTAHGKAVTVYVLKRPDGTRVAVVIDADCAVGERVKL